MSRYLRQMALPEIGPAGQARITAARALVVGAGALGVPVLQYLTGAGVGRITLVDPDSIEESNLHRQPLYRMADLGHPKAAVAARAMAGLNPEVTVAPRCEWLTPANAPLLVADADVVLDCADSYAVSYTLSDACLAAGRPLISASALGMTGYVGGYCGGAPSLRALFGAPPGSGQTCASAGVLGPVVGMLGCLEAQMALSVILDLTPSPLGQFTRFAGGRFSGFRFDGAPEQPGPRFIAQDQIGAGDFVIDLRGPDEAPRPVTPAALRWPGYGADGPLPAAGQRAVLACRTGFRAWRAADALSRRWPGEAVLVAAVPETAPADANPVGADPADTHLTAAEPAR